MRQLAPALTLLKVGATTSPQTWHLDFQGRLLPLYGSNGINFAISIILVASLFGILVVKACFLIPHFLHPPYPLRMSCKIGWTTAPHNMHSDFQGVLPSINGSSGIKFCSSILLVAVSESVKRLLQ
jgi:hypothetical protein